MDILAGYLEWLRGHGVVFEAGGCEREPDHDGPLVAGEGARRAIELPGLPPFVEHRGDGFAADHATLSTARALVPRVAPGSRFWDVGCGTGVLAVAAGLAGARVVLASDVAGEAVTHAKRTAAEANVRVQFLVGPGLDPYPADAVAPDLAVANLPHKPVPDGISIPVSQAGGPDGDAVHGVFARQARERFLPGTRVVFFLHSLPHPRLLREWTNGFDLTLLSWKRRFLQAGEYADCLDVLERRVHDGCSFWRAGNGRRCFVAGVWEAVRR